MTTRPKVRGGFSRTGHRIDEIDYSEDFLICICGWKGYAYDKLKGTNEFVEKKDYPTHRKTADPINSMEFDDKYKGNYGTVSLAAKEESAKKKYGHSQKTHGAVRRSKEKVVV